MCFEKDIIRTTGGNIANFIYLLLLVSVCWKPSSEVINVSDKCSFALKSFLTILKKIKITFVINYFIYISYMYCYNSTSSVSWIGHNCCLIG